MIYVLDLTHLWGGGNIQHSTTYKLVSSLVASPSSECYLQVQDQSLVIPKPVFSHISTLPTSRGTHSLWLDHQVRVTSQLSLSLAVISRYYQSLISPSKPFPHVGSFRPRTCYPKFCCLFMNTQKINVYLINKTFVDECTALLNIWRDGFINWDRISLFIIQNQVQGYKRLKSETFVNNTGARHHL